MHLENCVEGGLEGIEVKIRRTSQETTEIVVQNKDDERGLEKGW